MITEILRRALAAVALAFASNAVAAPIDVSGQPVRGGMALIANGVAPFIVTDTDDDPAVLRAAAALRADFGRITGNLTTRDQQALPVLIGTIGQSRLIDQMVAAGRLDVSSVKGRWEHFVQAVVTRPAPGIARALVIAGADRRGTVFGTFDLSARIGVSPWYWWADVPVTRRAQLYVEAGHRIDGPSVRYRGIFINDEEPALGSWARARFGGVNARFYERVFDLVLRLKGNMIWPAMWGKSLWQDDPATAALAQDMGIVLGTSHHEPMMRAHVEWQRGGGGAWDYRTNKLVLERFWRDGIARSAGQDRIVTVGMRGDGDEPMTQETAVSLLEQIVADQRRMIADVTRRPPAETPQVWALYKEVQDYYDKGMRVPDDVTLLFSDDNWGNVRRLPSPDAKRAGGYGVYYHFDYVGDPRNYKWINTTQIERIWEQMGRAHAHGADRLWIANVGDIKPMELPISFFLDFAWKPKAWPVERLPAYYRQWAAQQFGPAAASTIGAILAETTRLNARRKPELLDADYYRYDDDDEQARIRTDYQRLARAARQLKVAKDSAYADAFYHLVQHPIDAMANLHRLYAAVARRNKPEVELAFAEDRAIAARYEGTAGDKWPHMMAQTHISYTGWQQPDADVLPSPVDWSIERAAWIGPTATPVAGTAVERNGLIVIEAPDAIFGRSKIKWSVIPNLGHWKGSVTVTPMAGPAFVPGRGPTLDYPMMLGRPGAITIGVYASPSLDTDGSGKLRYAIALDDAPPAIVDLMAGGANRWAGAVADNIRIGTSQHIAHSAGRHRVRIWAVDRGVVIQRIVVTRGRLPRSKLGPRALTSNP